VADGPERQSRYAVRWLRRLLEEDPTRTCWHAVSRRNVRRRADGGAADAWRVERAPHLL